MLLRNLSTRTVSLRDADANLYIVDALGILEVDDLLLTDDTFKRWLRYRIRDVIIAPQVSVQEAGDYIGTQGKLNFIAGSNISILVENDDVNGEVDITIDGISLTVKASALAATTANITLSGAQTLDGVAVVAGDRVLVKDQTDTTKNGIYIVSNSTWARALDADESEEMTSNSFVFVQSGATFGDTSWVLSVRSPFSLGADAITWLQFSSAASLVGGNGIDKTGNVLSVNVDGSTIEIDSDILQVKDNSIGLTQLNNSNVEGLTNVPSLRTLGTGALQACPGDDARLGDSRPPFAHAASHESGGSDAIRLDQLDTPIDVTTLNATTGHHGLMPKLDGNAAHYMDGTGNFTAPGTVSTGASIGLIIALGGF